MKTPAAGASDMTASHATAAPTCTHRTGHPRWPTSLPTSMCLAPGTDIAPRGSVQRDALIPPPRRAEHRHAIPEGRISWLSEARTAAGEWAAVWRSVSFLAGVHAGQVGDGALPLVDVEAATGDRAGPLHRVYSESVEAAKRPQQHGLVPAGGGQG